jgi:hypothetical protein
MTISPTVKQDLQWCLDNLSLVQANIHPSYPDLLIQTDASNQGWGFYVPIDGTKSGARWAQEHVHFHINVLELIAIEFALYSYCNDMADLHVRIMSDNTTAIAAINKQGSTKALECNTVARRIWHWALPRKIWLSAAHIPGVQNVEADDASRVFKDELEWTLSHTVFQDIVAHFGQPDIDLFASHLNCKVPIFCSFKPDPLAHTIDAFNLNWHNMLGYAFPPFCLLGRVLQKIVQDGAMVIVVAPYWPTKPWFTMFQRMLMSAPYKILVEPDTLFLPHRNPDEDPAHRLMHPMTNKLTLMAGKLSGTRFC